MTDQGVMPPPYHLLAVEDQRRKYWEAMLDKFVDLHLVTPGLVAEKFDKDTNLPDLCLENTDFIKEHSLLLLKYYFLMADFKDAVKAGNGQRINELHKQLIHHFK